MEKMNALSFTGRSADREDTDHEEVGEHFNDMNWELATFVERDENRYDSEWHEDLENDSPYPEVRAAVPNTDDPSMPVSTFRVWYLGLINSIIFPGINALLGLRYPSVYIGPLVIQLVALPMGKMMEKCLPTTRFKTCGYTWSLNPGPFNIKEHTIITVIGAVTAGGNYATDVVLTQKLFYHQDFGFGYQILIALSSQLFGLFLAGMTRKFLVWPASMLWPGVLFDAALISMLHKSWGSVEKRHISRHRFFSYCALGSAVYYFFPGYIFTALSMFNWVCWIAPNEAFVNQLFGYSTGLGMGFLTFDWNMISYIGSPLVTPWWAQANVFANFFISIWIIVPIMYFFNVWFSAHLPISGGGAFDNTGNRYDPTLVVSDGVFNATAYAEYSPIYLPITSAISYGLAFATSTALISHTLLWYRKDILRLFRSNLSDHKDVHAHLMMSYREVPAWWYAATGVITFTFAVITVEVYSTQTPVWALILALLIAFIYVIPAGILQAITNTTFSTNVLAELVVGYILPGRPIASMVFKTYCCFGASQAISFTAALKLGHYMKVPPRAMFWALTLGSAVCCFVNLAVQNWMVDNIGGLCTPDQSAGFSCPSTNTFFTASLLWGAIGPQRLFSPGQIYSQLLWLFPIGFLLPFPFYYAARRYPKSCLRYINFPVFFRGTGALPPATGINYSAWFATGFVFQYFMRRRHFRWWLRYNYLLSAALDSGVAIGAIIIFFCLQVPRGGIKFDWWGNTVWQKTADANGIPFIVLAEGQTFGPPPVSSSSSLPVIVDSPSPIVMNS